MLHPKQFFRAHPTVLRGYKEVTAKRTGVVGMNKKMQTALE